MKTTAEISDDLFREAKRYAAQNGLTLRTVIENGIRSVLREAEAEGRPFVLRDASVGGSGLSPEFREGGWPKLRDAIYDGRGG